MFLFLESLRNRAVFLHWWWTRSSSHFQSVMLQPVFCSICNALWSHVWLSQAYSSFKTLSVQVPALLWSLTSSCRPLLIDFSKYFFLPYTHWSCFSHVCLSCWTVWTMSCSLKLVVSTWSPFHIVMFNTSWSELNRASHSAVFLRFVVNPCLGLDWKCVLCPAVNAEGNLDEMECYTNSNLAKLLRLSKGLWETMMSLSGFIHKRILQTGGMSAACCGCFYDITIKQILLPSTCKALWWISDIPQIWALLQRSHCESRCVYKSNTK